MLCTYFSYFVISLCSFVSGFFEQVYDVIAKGLILLNIKVDLVMNIHIKAIV